MTNSRRATTAPTNGADRAPSSLTSTFTSPCQGNQTLGNAKTLLNVGFSCSPEHFMGGEISLYRPRQDGLACPACVSLNAAGLADIAADPMFFPPLAVLAGLAVHLLAAEITNFDKQGDARPNFFLYDAFAHELHALRVPRDPNCAICGSVGARTGLEENAMLAAQGECR